MYQDVIAIEITRDIPGVPGLRTTARRSSTRRCRYQQVKNKKIHTLLLCNFVFYNFEKKDFITVAELKLKIFRQVDSLEKSRLEELYGVMLNYINGQKDLDDWIKLTTEQQQGIIDAIEEIESGKGIPHETVMTNIRRKFSHA